MPTQRSAAVPAQPGIVWSPIFVHVKVLNNHDAAHSYGRVLPLDVQHFLVLTQAYKFLVHHVDAPSSSISALRIFLYVIFAVPLS